MLKRIVEFFKSLWKKLFGSDDTPSSGSGGGVPGAPIGGGGMNDNHVNQA